MRYFIYTILSFTLLSMSLPTHALQQIHNDISGEQLKLNISSQTLTRITIVGERINKIISDSNRFITETDAVSGTIFIRAKDKQAFPLFLTTEAGNTYHLLLTPQAISADNIEIIPPQHKEADNWAKRTPYQTAITQLIKGMANNTPPTGYRILADEKITAPLFSRPIKTTAQAIYQGKHLQGTVFTLTNTGKTTITLHHTLLDQPNVLAVAFADEQLAPKQTTTAYQIRRRDNDNAQ